MPNNVVLLGNLDGDAVVDDDTKKIRFESVTSGPAAPVSPPPAPLKSWLYVRTGDPIELYAWDPEAEEWLPLPLGGAEINESYEADLGFNPGAVGQPDDFVEGPTFVLNIGFEIPVGSVAHLHGTSNGTDGLYEITTEPDIDGDQTFTRMDRQYEGDLALLLVNFDLGEAEADPPIPGGLRAYVSYYDVGLPGFTLSELTNQGGADAVSEGSADIRYHRFEAGDGDPQVFELEIITLNGIPVLNWNHIEIVVSNEPATLQFPDGEFYGSIDIRLSLKAEATTPDLTVLAPPTGGSISHGRDLGDEVSEHYGQTCNFGYMTPSGTRLYHRYVTFDQYVQIHRPTPVAGVVVIEAYLGEYQPFTLTEDTEVQPKSWNSDDTVRTCRFVTTQDGTGGWELTLDAGAGAVWEGGVAPSPPTTPGAVVEYEQRQVGAGAGSYTVVKMLSSHTP